MWYLVKYDQKWTFLVKMDMGVAKWNTMPNGTCTTINFGKENITYKCLQVVGKPHIDR
jgi:hypothetical protein